MSDNGITYEDNRNEIYGDKDFCQKTHYDQENFKSTPEIYHDDIRARSKTDKPYDVRLCGRIALLREKPLSVWTL
jgi:hypothetical protein